MSLIYKRHRCWHLLISPNLDCNYGVLNHYVLPLQPKEVITKPTKKNAKCSCKLTFNLQACPLTGTEHFQCLLLNKDHAFIVKNDGKHL